MRLRRRTLLPLAAGAAAWPTLSIAQNWPTQPARLVEGYGAGSAPDIIARLIGQRLSERLGKPFVIENKPGASGKIATEAVARARPDGYTLLLVLVNNCIDAVFKERLSYDFVRDIAPVGGIYRMPMVMEVHPSVPAGTVPEFIAWVKGNKDKVNLASAGTGTVTHIAGELFQMMAQINLFHVPYRGSQVFLGMTSGQVQVYFGPLASSLPLIKAGKLRALAVTSKTRPDVLPDVPTLDEFLPGFDFTAWYGIGAPNGTPAGIVDRLNTEVNAALGDPDFKRQLADMGGTVMPGSPADFGKFITSEVEKMEKVIRAANITVE